MLIKIHQSTTHQTGQIFYLESSQVTILYTRKEGFREGPKNVKNGAVILKMIVTIASKQSSDVSLVNVR